MNVITFAIELDNLRFKIIADVLKDLLHAKKDCFRKDMATIFGDEDQMNMHVENTVAAGTNFICFCHRPSVTFGYYDYSKSLQVSTQSDCQTGGLLKSFRWLQSIGME